MGFTVSPRSLNPKPSTPKHDTTEPQIPNQLQPAWDPQASGGGYGTNAIRALRLVYLICVSGPLDLEGLVIRVFMAGCRAVYG